MSTLARIWRHPIKGIGAEELGEVTLAPGLPVPGDRAYAVLTGTAEDTGAWQPCRNFARGCYGPELMAITAHTDADGRITLRHPARPELTIDPATDGAALIDWLTPIYPPERPAPHTLIKAPEIGMADSSTPATISVLGTASLAALSEKAGQPLDQRRFRGNLWIDGLAPFEELSLVGRTLRIGDAELEFHKRIERCRATEANPDTGTRDVDTLRHLREGWGHTDFGITALVRKPGRIAPGMEVTVV
ncbi:MOSC domain-containing protein [Rhodalgimonas zhirmunskyi]|uniref:MOSC domain-containing protein n=1 Tax=Rhodalgimonas zhirmunskyi TaxID=2964767 RepID=A0AAJ1UDM5_9RHOB|nr:MOSC domain-containing protein [Rhodoalgimonas zhirmunskyi]MDQ2095598.1 MOSC domain-containing protein [Rhodoalgimonas zhirmunskyi]